MIKHVLRLITARIRHNSPRLVGECNQCGECCRNLTLVDDGAIISDETGFEKLLRKHPEYGIFSISHRDPDQDILYFHCTQLGDDNLCRIHRHRPKICRIYPNPRMFAFGARLPEACGYRLDPKSEFPVMFQNALAQKQKSRRH